MCVFLFTCVFFSQVTLLKMAEEPNEGSSTEELCTLMVKGLPTGVTEREFNGYFMFAEGFEKSMMHTWQQSVGYALFDTERNAKRALDFLQGRKIEHTVLRAQWANRNLKERKKDMAPDAPIPTSQYVKFQKPSNTLYIGGINGMSEEDLGDILLELKGFTGMKYVPSDKHKDSAVCFAQFATVELATRGLGRLEGGLLSHCKKLILDYSKSPLVSPPQTWPGDCKPCNTLHLGPLPNSFCNSDVQQFLSTMSGYESHRITQMLNRTVCFVRFDSIAGCRLACDASFPSEWGECSAQFARKSLQAQD